MSLVTPADLTESGDYHAAAFELPAACDFSVFQDSFGASRTLVARPSLVDCDPAPGTPLLISWCTDAFSRFTVWECAMLGYGTDNMCDHQRRGAGTAASNCGGPQPATEACGTSGHRAGFGRSGTSAAGCPVPRRQSADGVAVAAALRRGEGPAIRAGSFISLRLRPLGSTRSKTSSPR